jgi:hypothetical protein
MYAEIYSVSDHKKTRGKTTWVSCTGRMLRIGLHKEKRAGRILRELQVVVNYLYWDTDQGPVANPIRRTLTMHLSAQDLKVIMRGALRYDLLGK